jgi:hypothetical protein
MNFNLAAFLAIGIASAGSTGLAQLSNKANANYGNSIATGRPTDTELKSYELEPVDGEDARVATELNFKTQRLINQKDFSGLDQLADDLRNSKKHNADGKWHLRTFYLAIAFDLQKDTVEKRRITRLAFLQSWIEARKHSITARVALASFYTSYAWYARGAGYADTVSKEAWPLFTERLELAKQTLLEAQKLESKCPGWWDVMQRVALGQNWDLASYDKLFNEAIAFEPTYVSFYNRKVVFLLPRWHGKEGDWQKFAAESADKLGGEAGDVLYAQIGWFVHSERFYEAFLKEAVYSWPRMKKGLETIVKKYPESISAVSELAYLAYQANDRDCAKPLFQRLDKTVDREVWKLDYDRYLRARNWALSK